MQEIEGLAAVLHLITTVSYHSDQARTAIVQNDDWQPILVMIGLLGCAVPTVLKAELLKTLSALAKTSDVAMQVWTGVEASSFVTSPQVGGNWTKCGFQMELESVESKNEEYPISTRMW